MMKYLAPLFVVFGLVCFTDPQGMDVWVSRSEIVTVLHPVDCDKRANSKIITSNGFLCVQEKPREIIKAIEELPPR